MDNVRGAGIIKDAIVTVVSIVCGLYLNIAYEHVFNSEIPYLQNPLTIVTLFVFLTGILVFSLVFKIYYSYTRSIKKSDKVSEEVLNAIENNRELIDKLILNKVELFKSEDAYKKMSVEVLGAKKIQLLSRIRHDGTKATNNEGGLVSPSREEYYRSLYSAAMNPEVHFNRIIMVDSSNILKWHDLVSDFKVLGKEIVNVFKSNIPKPSTTSFQIAKASLEMNMILLDERKLFFNVFTETAGKDYVTGLMFYVESDDHGFTELIGQMNEIKFALDTVKVVDADADKINQKISQAY